MKDRSLGKRRRTHRSSARLLLAMAWTAAVVALASCGEDDSTARTQSEPAVLGRDGSDSLRLRLECPYSVSALKELIPYYRCRVTLSNVSNDAIFIVRNIERAVALRVDVPDSVSNARNRPFVYTRSAPLHEEDFGWLPPAQTVIGYAALPSEEWPLPPGSYDIEANYWADFYAYTSRFWANDVWRLRTSPRWAHKMPTRFDEIVLDSEPVVVKVVEGPLERCVRAMASVSGSTASHIRTCREQVQEAGEDADSRAAGDP